VSSSSGQTSSRGARCDVSPGTDRLGGVGMHCSFHPSSSTNVLDHALARTLKMLADSAHSTVKLARLFHEVEPACSDDVLFERLKVTTIFARLAPLQKARIIRLLRANNHVVGYLGDGINDAPSLKAADVGISVNNAVDIAKESADIILLKKSLMVLEDGVVEGRKTFTNIIKYIRMGASSNFGNMLSMTGASLFLPFLPMLPIQILLNNFLYDLSQIGIPSDKVDRENLIKPKRWDIAGIRRFMMVFGPLSSIFDFTTYAILYFFYKADPAFFHTGWFLESLLTQTLVIYVIRTSKIPFVQSTPSAFMMFTSIAIIAVGLVIPFTPFSKPLGFVVPPSSYLVALMFLVAGYLLLVQSVKIWFVRKYSYD
jgi:Mg2+-importing ATPase